MRRVNKESDNIMDFLMDQFLKHYGEPSMEDANDRFNYAFDGGYGGYLWTEVSEITVRNIGRTLANGVNFTVRER